MVATPFAATQARAATTHTRASNELILRVAMQDDIKTLNPLVANDVWTWNVIGWVFDSLTWQNASNNDHIEPWASEFFHHGPNSTWSSQPWADNDNNTDFLNWTVKLRPQMKWHDWATQTGDDQYVRAHDVIFSLRLVADVARYAGSVEPLVAHNPDGSMMYGRDIDANTTNGIYEIAPGYSVDISSEKNYPALPVVLVTADSDGLTLHYHLTHTYADFTTDTLSALIFPERIWKNHISDKLTWEDPQELINFGPFKFDFWDKTAQVSRIDTFRDYFHVEYDKQTGKPMPFIDAILFKVYGTTDAAVMALTSDEVDYIAWAIDPGFIDTINSHSNLALVRSSDLGFFYVAFNMRKPDFGYEDYSTKDIPAQGSEPTYDNGNYTDVGKPFRIAFAHIIDKQQIVSKFLQGFGSVGTSVVSPVNSFWYNPNIKIYDYDPAKAKDILDAAGYKDTNGNGIRELPNRGEGEIDMMTPPADYDPIRAQAGLLIQQDAQAIGLNFKSIPTNFGTIVQQIDSHQFDMYMLGWSIPSPISSATAPCDFFGSKNDGGGQNYPGYHNQSFDKLCEQMKTELDINKRKQIDNQLQAIIAEDVPYSVLYYRDVLEAYNTRFTGWVPRYGTIFNWYSLKQLKAQPESNYEISLSAPTTVNGGTPVTITAYVDDKTTKDPISGATVTFSVDNGTLSLTQGTTDQYGKLEVTYTPPSPNATIGVNIKATVHDATNDVDIQTTQFITILPPSTISLDIEISPNTPSIAVNSGKPTTISLTVSDVQTGEAYKALDANKTGVLTDYTITPAEGGTLTLISSDNGTWKYQFTGTAAVGKTVQYTVTITAKYLQNNATLSSANKKVVFSVIGAEPPHNTTTSSTTTKSTPSIGIIPVLVGVSLAAVAYNYYRRKR